MNQTKAYFNEKATVEIGEIYTQQRTIWGKRKTQLRSFNLKDQIVKFFLRNV